MDAPVIAHQALRFGVEGVRAAAGGGRGDSLLQIATRAGKPGTGLQHEAMVRVRRVALRRDGSPADTAPRARRYKLAGPPLSVAMAPAPPKPADRRLWEIDALRGLMLVLMTLTHIPTR